MKREKSDLLGVLLESGIGSRRKIAAAIMQGRVSVNGKTADNLRHPVNPEKDTVSIDGKEIQIKTERVVCLALNKPAGVLSTVRDDRGRRTVIDLLPEKYRRLRLYPAGRLDKETTGLMILTNDGELANRITHPRYGSEKEYFIQINGLLKEDDIKRLEQGIELENGKTYPAAVKEVKGEPPYDYSITIHEGRKRQVRRMFAALGYKTLALKRVRIGGLTLGDLKEGEVMELKSKETKRLSG